MKWIDRMDLIRRQLNEALKEAADPEQAAATRSIMTSVDAWRYVDQKPRRTDRPGSQSTNLAALS
jgi:hypothetical protein